MTWLPWIAGPLFTLALATCLLVWFSWRNQNSPLVAKEDRWRAPSRRERAAWADFDPNAADTFPLADYAPGVIVPMHRSSVASVVSLPKRADVLRFPIERIEDRQPPPPAPYSPTPKGKPRLHLVKPLK
jgi:hypothetical protein